MVKDNIKSSIKLVGKIYKEVSKPVNKIYNMLADLGYDTIGLGQVGGLMNSKSLLTKNYNFIYEALNKNIGSIDYRQNIKSNYGTINSSDMIGDVVSIEKDTDQGLYNFLSEKRKDAVTYLDYADKLNISMLYKPYTINNGAIHIDSNILSVQGQEKIETKPYSLREVYDNDNVLTKFSNEYIEVVKEYDWFKAPHNVYYKFTDYTNPILESVYFDDKTDNKQPVRKEKYSSIFHDTEEYGVQFLYAELPYKNSGAKKDSLTFSNLNSKEGSTSSYVYYGADKCADLVEFTNKQFQEGKYKTLISRFGSYADGGSRDELLSEYEQMHTSISTYGTSHGRNLLRSKNGRNVHYEQQSASAYNDPYCRVWTSYHQYHQYNNLIRPFNSVKNDGTPDKPLTYDNLYEKFGMRNVRTNNVTTEDDFEFENGCKRLGKYGVLNPETNLVNIVARKDEKSNDENRLKQCMFSIENLAWKGFTDDLSDEQKGPLGGRIMWFPPYDIKFSENIQANWNSTEFIGRGERIYTYTNTDRTGNLSFKLLIDHPSVINYFQPKEDESHDDLGQTGLEYDLLRFFAGCESNISTKNKELLYDEKEENEEDDITEPTVPIEEKVKEEPPKRHSEPVKITFMVYFPNNYTGRYEKDDVDPIVYLINGVGAQTYTTDNGVTLKNIRTDDSVVYYSQGLNDPEVVDICGYEIRSDDSLNGITPFPLTTEENKNQPFSATSYNGYTLCPRKNTKYSPKYDWWYRSDDRVLHEKPRVGPCGCKDLKSYGLNSKEGFDRYVTNWFNLYNIDEKDTQTTFALTEVFVAMYNLFLNKDNKLLRTLDFKYCSQERLKILKGILQHYKDVKTQGGNIKAKLSIRGFASSHGYKASNDILSKNRAETIHKWLTNKIGFKFDTEEPFGQNDIIDAAGTINNNDLMGKRGRCSKVTITFEEEDNDELTNTLNTKNDESVSDSATTDNGYVPDFVKVSDYDAKYTQTSDDELESTLGEVTVVYTKNKPKHIIQVPKSANDRYDGEYQFFTELSNSDSFIRKQISDKIKYFDPAFHSISPEGFNARLTFLQQCTRQGPTIGNSNIGGEKTAANLAFGRQPVCVLRIGDFYYTKIVIDSISIDYDPLVWDLNIEGAGVQPMIANVSLSFKFLGGSDLGGPIGRLQNALSFNYYANTSVYDNRSEMIEYDTTTHKPNKYKANTNM